MHPASGSTIRIFQEVPFAVHMYDIFLQRTACNVNAFDPLFGLSCFSSHLSSFLVLAVSGLLPFRQFEV